MDIVVLIALSVGSVANSGTISCYQPYSAIGSAVQAFALGRDDTVACQRVSSFSAGSIFNSNICW